MKTKAHVSTEKQIVLNNDVWSKIFFLSFGFLLVSFGLWSDEIAFTLFGVFISLTFIVILLISPTHYVFSNENVVICHPFKRRETIYWEDVRSIKIYRSRFYRCGNGFNHYKIYYRHKKEVLFLKGEICKSKRTKQLLQKYYKGNVE